MLSKSRIKYINSLRIKKIRDIEQKFIIEGEKILLEVIKSNILINNLIATSDFISQIDEKYLPNIEEIIEVKQNEIEQVTNLNTPSKVLAIVDFLQNNVPEKEEIINSLSLLIDDLQDPGNLGTIIRTADWFGVKNIFCSTNTVNLYNPKVIQATMGSFLRVNVHYVDLENFLSSYEQYQNQNFQIYITAANKQSIYSSKLTENGLIIIGNEAQGVKEVYYQFASKQISIPSFNRSVESLNASISTAIILSEFSRN